MLLPPHTTTTTEASEAGSRPSSCSLRTTPLYTAASAAPHAGSTRIFSSSAGKGAGQLSTPLSLGPNLSPWLGAVRLNPAWFLQPMLSSQASERVIGA
ncbi:hypothetical protein I79_019208 [Cricetulus griseus]|uniref:Uncharacterized protein n=1 Tax=Cricetulus griseus TaxID=10029 RepID=G3I6T0_CRIGR|nr:hypothetical protein I79_019208 [Cricetulus griseus]